jgi:spore germination protein GerM
MGVRGTGGKKKRGAMMALLFWLIFFIVIIMVFIIQLPAIRGTLQSTRIVERLTNSPASEIEAEQPPSALVEEPPSSGDVIFIEPPPPVQEPVVPETGEPEPQSAAETARQDAGETQRQDTGETAAPPSGPEIEARERVIYFVKIDSSGMVYTSPVKRRVFVSDSPLMDSLNLLLQGPSEAEREQGFTSLIPDGVRLQSARVTGNTAVISFNENFMFNSYGAEGYIAQLRQTVWTATEFPNIRDVQILIEGRRIDFLGESIRINRPIGRDSL